MHMVQPIFDTFHLGIVAHSSCDADSLQLIRLWIGEQRAELLRIIRPRERCEQAYNQTVRLNPRLSGLEYQLRVVSG